MRFSFSTTLSLLLSPVLLFNNVSVFAESPDAINTVSTENSQAPDDPDNSTLKTSQEALKPDWSEFVPIEFQNAEIGPVAKPISNLIMLPACILWPTLLILLPIESQRLKKREYDLDRNYWAERRLSFNKNLQTCGASKGDKLLCYLQVRTMEQQKDFQRQMQQEMDRVRRTVAASNSYRR